MTDETKPAWWRCPKCKTRVWNDPIDKEAHGPVCPADLKRAIVRLAARVEELERIPVPESVQLEASFGPDLDSVDEGDLDDGPEDPEEQEVPDLAPVFEEVAALQVGDVTAEGYFAGVGGPTDANGRPVIPPAIDDYEDDEEDDDPAPIARPVMR